MRRRRRIRVRRGKTGSAAASTSSDCCTSSRRAVAANLPLGAAAFDAPGALRSNPLRDAPAEVTGGYRESDAKYETLTARRPVAEAAVASVVAKNDHVDKRRGVAVTGLLTSESHNGIPNVVGVQTDAGEELFADIVIDCGGRRSTLPKWLTEIGAPAP